MGLSEVKFCPVEGYLTPLFEDFGTWDLENFDKIKDFRYRDKMNNFRYGGLLETFEEMKEFWYMGFELI